MADNVTLPAQGIGTTQPIIESYDIGGGVQRQTVPPLASGSNVRVNSGTNNHKFSVVKW
jgi:hypothetical protein